MRLSIFTKEDLKKKKNMYLTYVCICMLYNLLFPVQQFLLVIIIIESGL